MLTEGLHLLEGGIECATGADQVDGPEDIGGGGLFAWTAEDLVKACGLVGGGLLEGEESGVAWFAFCDIGSDGIASLVAEEIEDIVLDLKQCAEGSCDFLKCEGGGVIDLGEDGGGHHGQGKEGGGFFLDDFEVKGFGVVGLWIVECGPKLFFEGLSCDDGECLGGKDLMQAHDDLGGEGEMGDALEGVKVQRTACVDGLIRIEGFPDRGDTASESVAVLEVVVDKGCVVQDLDGKGGLGDLCGGMRIFRCVSLFELIEEGEGDGGS